MIWQYINTGEHTGSFNMDFDMNLVNETGPDNVILRLYRWRPYCISLGANQSISEINVIKAETEGIDIVKRPTGGRAILHSEELTYSVVMPLTGELSPRQIYGKINTALILGLKIYHPGLTELELEGLQPDMLSFYRQNLSAACFGVPAKSEIKYSGRKIVGSAQRKIGNVLLQHGSIMCGSFHVNLADYLNLDKNEISLIKDDLKNKTTELESILQHGTDYALLEESIVAGFEKFFGVNMFREELIKN
jgi:lipoyl(octanoyl) transferase